MPYSVSLLLLRAWASMGRPAGAVGVYVLVWRGVVCVTRFAWRIMHKASGDETRAAAEGPRRGKKRKKQKGKQKLTTYRVRPWCGFVGCLAGCVEADDPQLSSDCHGEILRIWLSTRVPTVGDPVSFKKKGLFVYCGTLDMMPCLSAWHGSLGWVTVIQYTTYFHCREGDR
jgi:hypothetical protein